MSGTTLTLRNAGGEKRVVLGHYLDPAAEEAAHEAAYAWIKGLRGLEVDGAPFRDRFTVRGDSLWWFSELYLHKERVVLDIHRTIAAATRLIDEEHPASMAIASSSPVSGHVVPALAAARSIACTGGERVRWGWRLARLDARARLLSLSGAITPERWGRVEPHPPAKVAAFIHRAFWRAGIEDGAAESYIGPILHALEHELGAEAVRYVGIGPAISFASPAGARPEPSGHAAPVPVERFAGRAALRESRATWRRRYAHFRLLTQAASLRAAARMGGVDCWPLVREQLAGVTSLQWPWSVRAMDEAGAALDTIAPRVALTYAEAGGWGRALVLESRRRGIPTVGLQHGFIYRHWLNYRHEPDELAAGRTPPFPHPTRTLLFDDYAARHLLENGRFPPESLCVTGSPRLDELVRETASIDGNRAADMRARLSIGSDDLVVLVATKEKEARASLRTLLDAAAGLPRIAVVIKPHPAETAAAYDTHVAGRSQVRVAPADVSLAGLLALARAVATVNSTVAIDAGAMGIPALSFGLPNNLSPFVEAGAMAGSPDAAELPAQLQRILYDEQFRQQLARERHRLFGDPAAARNDGAASRSAGAIIELIRTGR